MKLILILFFNLAVFKVTGNERALNINRIISKININDNHLNPSTELKEIFELLKEDNLDISSSSRIILIQKLQFFKQKYELSDDIFLEFYQDKIDSLKEKGALTIDLYREMSDLAYLFEGPHSYFNLFKNLSSNITLKNCEKNKKRTKQKDCLTKNDLKIYGHLLDSIKKTRFTDRPNPNLFSKEFFNTISETALFSIGLIAQGSSFELSFHFLNNYFSLFDQNPKIFSALENCINGTSLIANNSSCLDELYSFVDIKINKVLYQFSTLLREASWDKKITISSLVEHPYLEMYLIRYFMETSFKKEAEVEVDRLIQKTFYQDDLSYEMMFKIFFSRINRNREFYVHFLEKFDSYHQKIYQLEFIRFYREILHFRNDRNNLKLDSNTILEIDKNYNYQVSLLIDILNIRYEREMSLELLTFDNDSHNHNLLRLLSKGEVIKDLKKDIVTNLGSCREDGDNLLCENINLLTGIFYVQNDILIQGNKIRMGPLAMIYAPGRSMTFNFDKIDNLWLDASGMNASLKPRKPIAKDLETHRFPPKVARNGAAPNVKSVTPPYHKENNVKVHSAGNIGNRGGNITLNIKWKAFGIPLLVVKGSRGQQGADGIKSLHCIEGRPRDYVLTWAADENYTEIEVFERESCTGT